MKFDILESAGISVRYIDRLRKLLGTAMKAIKQETNGDALYIKPTSNQPRITRWLKKYARARGLPIYRTSVNDRHTDVKYRQLQGLYRMMDD